jgi:pre-mRNA-splicing factor ATP-dependent RNA helicase DHX15/PRP43
VIENRLLPTTILPGHLHPTEREMSSGETGEMRDPLQGFVPRMVNGEQARKAMEGDANPFTKQPHSAQYKEILEARKKLPVYGQMDEFFQMVCAFYHSCGSR